VIVERAVTAVTAASVVPAVASVAVVVVLGAAEARGTMALAAVVSTTAGVMATLRKLTLLKGTCIFLKLLFYSPTQLPSLAFVFPAGRWAYLFESAKAVFITSFLFTVGTF